MNSLKIKLLMNKFIYISYNLLILFISYLFNRFFQMLLFILFYNAIQDCFNYRFHAETIFRDDPIKAVKYCKIITITVEIMYLITCKNLNISLYSNLILIFIISFINALLQFYCERIIINKSILKDKHLLIQLAKENNISDLAIHRLIEHYVNNKTIIEIAKIENVEEITIKQSIRRTKRKLGL